MKEFVFKGEQGEKLVRYLGQVFPELGRSYLRQLLKDKDIKINDVRVSQDTPLFFGDKISVYAVESRLQIIKTELVFKTPDIAVYIKPRGITTEEFSSRISLAQQEARLCHRLDTNTEGLLLFALKVKAYEHIKEAFKNDYIHKFYIARVIGNLKKEGILNAFLLKDEAKGIVKILEQRTEGAVPIITSIKPLSYDESNNTTLVEIGLITGKTHQIRAHLAHIGHPIVGDPKYGDFLFNRKTGKEKQLLSAYKLSFSFPKQSPLFYLNKQEIIIQQDFI